MYTAYFGFNTKPFKPKDSAHYYRNGNFDAACADILDGIRERRGFILLTGEAGVGKTLVMRRCIAEGADIRFIQLLNASLGFHDILNYLCSNLGLAFEDLDADRQKQLLLETLASQARRGQVVALLMDDAQHLSGDVLLRLRDFIETPALPSQRLQVVLVGLPEIAAKLERPEFSALQHSIRVRCHLEPLSDLETGLFIQHQIEAAGSTAGSLFSPAAIERIGFYCRGVPRAIAILCDAILLLASLQSEREITPALVDDAAQNCFLGEQAKGLSDNPNSQRGALPSDDPQTPAVGGSPELQFDLAEFDFLFEFDDRTALAKKPVATAKPVAEKALSSGSEPVSVPTVVSASTISADLSQPATHLNQSVGLETPEELPHQSPVPLSTAALDGFQQLLNDLAGKLERNHPQRQEPLRYFLNRYQRMVNGDEPKLASAFQQRIARLAEIQQPILVGLASTSRLSSEQDSVLCVFLFNSTWWLFREIRLRFRGTDLMLANDGRVAPLRLLDGRDTEVVYLNYRCPFADMAQTQLWLEVDVCDHRGNWHAYNTCCQIRLDFSDDSAADFGSEQPKVEEHDQFWPDSSPDPLTDGAWLQANSPSGSAGTDQATSALVCTLPLELEADPARTNHLREVTARALGRGTPLTRALLLAADSSQAPTRIELVSRPFMIFGRHSSATGTGFGDFSLGFVPKYTRISRLHCVICGLADQLALMSASNTGRTYTGRNGHRLERGQWELLAADDCLEICDLYRLKMVFAWDSKWNPTSVTWDPKQPRDKFGQYLLSVVDILRQRDQQAEAEDLRKILRQRYLNLLRVQDRVSRLNGVGNPGSLLYVRFEREDAAAARQVVHFYIPKWLSVGSSPQDGLCIHADGVKPHHAEILFRDGMYWIQNLADPGAVRVGHHDLATNEALALESGDAILIGTAWFTFEGY